MQTEAFLLFLGASEKCYRFFNVYHDDSEKYGPLKYPSINGLLRVNCAAQSNLHLLYIKKSSAFAYAG